MRRMGLVMAALLCLPAITAAQRGGSSRSGATSRTDMFSDDPAKGLRASVTSSKLSDLNPLAILLDKHQDLKLTDDQVSKLKTMNDQLAGVNKEAFHVLDSLNQQLRNIGSGGGMDDQSQAQTLNTFVRMIARTTRQRYDSVENAARGLLSDDQKKKADDVLGDSHDALSKLVGRGRNL